MKSYNTIRTFGKSKVLVPKKQKGANPILMVDSKTYISLEKERAIDIIMKLPTTSTDKEYYLCIEDKSEREDRISYDFFMIIVTKNGYELSKSCRSIDRFYEEYPDLISA